MSVFRETNCVIPTTTIARLFCIGLPYISLASKSRMYSWVEWSCISAIPRSTLHAMPRVCGLSSTVADRKITRQRNSFQVRKSTLSTFLRLVHWDLNYYDWELKVDLCILFFGFRREYAKSTSQYSTCFWRALCTCRRLYCTRGLSVTGILNLPTAFSPLFYGSVCFYLCSYLYNSIHIEEFCHRFHEYSRRSDFFVIFWKRNCTLKKNIGILMVNGEHGLHSRDEK